MENLEIKQKLILITKESELKDSIIKYVAEKALAYDDTTSFFTDLWNGCRKKEYLFFLSDLINNNDIHTFFNKYYKEITFLAEKFELRPYDGIDIKTFYSIETFNIVALDLGRELGILLSCRVTV